MQNLIIFGAITAYATYVLTQTFKQYTKCKYIKLVALILSLTGVFCMGLSIFQAFGIPTQGIAARYFDLIITGIVLSRGSNAIHDIQKRIGGITNGKDSKTQP